MTFFHLIVIVRSLNHFLLPEGGTETIATIHLHDFTANGAAAVIHIFVLWGLSQVLFGLIYVIVLWRYQTLNPLMYVFIIIEYSMWLVLTLVRPFESSGTAPGGTGNYVIIPF